MDWWLQLFVSNCVLSIGLCSSCKLYYGSNHWNLYQCAFQPLETAGVSQWPVHMDMVWTWLKGRGSHNPWSCRCTLSAVLSQCTQKSLPRYSALSILLRGWHFRIRYFWNPWIHRKNLNSFLNVNEMPFLHAWTTRNWPKCFSLNFWNIFYLNSKKNHNRF